MRIGKKLHKAFTLIELLVVVSVIALLVSILLPSLSNARQTATRTKCLANLHQIGLAMHMYAVQNNDHFPNVIALGGFTFRAAPGYKNPADPRSFAENYGLAALLERECEFEGNSDVWICTAQPKWMQSLGNTYAFSIAGVLSRPTSALKNMYKQWLVWDNYTVVNFIPGIYCGSGSTAGYTIPTEQRKIPHAFGRVKDGVKAVNVLFMDGRCSPQIEQLK